jgi:hypothetical protein
VQAIPEGPAAGRLDRTTFEALVAAHRPVLLRGLATSWPAVLAARQGLESCLRFWLERATDEPLDALLAHPREQGRLGWRPDLNGFSFVHERKPLGPLLEALWRYAQFAEPPALAVQSVDLRRCLPGFEADHPMPLLDAGVAPRLWLGNRATVPAHFDSSYNLAVVVAGRRRFTLLPPQHIENLYLGPLEKAPTQAPVFLVDVLNPDFERFPRARPALAEAQQAVLEPGDALFLPPLWVHAVESLDPALNGLVNHWWRPETAVGAGADSPSAALRLAALSFRGLPAAERRDWQRLFALLAFEDADWSHIPTAQLGLLGALDADTVHALREQIRGLIPTR